ncbi:MAG TPA: YggS family pyridoxal phosphate-dependent enzyme [Thermoanaerobaculia bacterium]|nr:YggS family pyridoxal phosphate-dependent enzyme [Thermoanaerobaculia bacterium]
MLTPDEIRTNYAAVVARIDAACRRATRRTDEVTLVAVSKTFPAETVTAVIAAGATDVGENRVQEARDKKPVARGSARWHLIGHLQSNKAREAVRTFDVIQTIDSVSLAERVAKAAAAEGKRIEVMLEVNIGREPQKTGADPESVDALARDVAKIDSLHLIGLMTIPPQTEEAAARAYFRELRSMRDRLGLRALSMGMTDDFEMAIEEGATIVRVGRAIFGARG